MAARARQLTGQLTGQLALLGYKWNVLRFTRGNCNERRKK